LERISLCGIARVAQVSETWLQQYVNEKYALVQRQVEVTPKKPTVAKLAGKACKLERRKY